MSDDSGAEYQPLVEQGTASQEQEVRQPKTVTEDYLEERLSRLADELKRAVQSLTDKQESRVNKKLDTYAAALREQGVEATEEMLARKRLQLAEAEADRAISDDKPAQDVGPAVDPAVVRDVRLKMAKLQAQLDYVPDGNEPEFHNFNWSDPDPARFLQGYEARLRKVATRVGAEPQVQTLPGNASARVPGPSGMVGGDREQQLNTRLQTIQTQDPFKRDPTLSKERSEILKELEAMHRNR